MPELQKYKCQARFHVSTLKYFAQLNICSPTVLTVCYSFQNVQLVRSNQSLYTIDFAEDPLNEEQKRLLFLKTHTLNR